MQPMKRRVVRGPTLNLVARSFIHRAQNHSAPSNENVDLRKSILHCAPRSTETPAFPANGTLEPLQRQCGAWRRIEERLGGFGITSANPRTPRFNRHGDMIFQFCLTDSCPSTARPARADKLVRSGFLTENPSKADVRGAFQLLGMGLGFRRTERGLHTEVRGESNAHGKSSEKVATVRKVRATLKSKGSSPTSKRRRVVGRLVPTTTIPRRSLVDVDVPNPVSVAEREMELESPTQRGEGLVATDGHDVSVELVDEDDHEETQQKGYRAQTVQITRTSLPPEMRSPLYDVTGKEDEGMGGRASAHAMALLRAALDEADDEVEDGKVGAELQRSLRVGIVGAPNAGKSLLTNQLVGTRVSAVSRKTNTTHREHLGVYTKRDTQLLYYDTPGLHLDIEGSPLRVDAQHRVRNAWEIVDFCEALVVLVDAERQIRRPDKRVQRLVEKLGSETVSQKRVLCLNKVDVIEQKRTLLPLAKQFEDLLGYDRIFMISGLTGSGVKDVKDYLVSQAVLRPWDEDPELKDHRDMALEVVREQVFEHLHEELPHTTKQQLVSWKVLKDGSIRIQQLLLVAKKEHQKILVGKNGAVIGDIGIKARKELTEILGATVHLVLDVKLMTPSMTSNE